MQHFNFIVAAVGMGGRKTCQVDCSLRRPRRRVYSQNAAEDGGLSVGY